MRRTILTLAIGSVLMFPALAEENPYAQADDTWISISGTVEAVSTDAFILDYGDGVVTVEMDDWDDDADAYKVVEGDSVTVTGMIDDDLFETTTIEASSVYVEGLNTYFYASAADEEDTFVTVATPVVASATLVQGVVTEVNDDEFTVDAGLNDITVEVDDMPYNPLDEEGFQKIEKGDRVSVAGQMDLDFFEGRVLEADSVVTLSKETG